ncbi:MAG: hypothetical protein ACRBBW_02460 [Cellvibrionaceae bacterium]
MIEFPSEGYSSGLQLVFELGFGQGSYLVFWLTSHCGKADNLADLIPTQVLA